MVARKGHFLRAQSRKKRRHLGLRFENLSLRVSSGDEVLDRGVCFVISGLQSAGGRVELGGLGEEEAVGQGAAEAVVKEDEPQGTA